MAFPELLSPAGDFEKLKAALLYGADAVYLAPAGLSLRASAGNFTAKELKNAFSYLRERGKKGCIALNIYPRDSETALLYKTIETLLKLRPDGVIVSDLGVFSAVKKIAPDIPVHVSTQANSVNSLSANAWRDLGAKRIILARELSIEEIKTIRKNTPEDLELEVFVHGAMCISYSGRCLMSSYMTGRDPNRGDCAQSCRWKYALVEEKRPGEYFDVFEDERGTYFFNSRDLCMLAYIPELLDAGVASFKIEGRAKSEYYVAAVTNAYRMAIDAYLKNPGRAFDGRLLSEVQKVSHRRYGTGFFFGDPKSNGQIYESSSYIREYEVVGRVEKTEGQYAWCVQRNRFFAGDRLELMLPGEFPIEFTADRLWDKNEDPIEAAVHPGMEFLIRIPKTAPAGAFLRKRK